MSGDSGYRAFSTQHHIMIRQETIDTILERTDIVTLIGEHVHLRKCGTRHVGCCPFHNEKTPSFYVSPQTGRFKCFGCGEGGDAIHFIEKDKEEKNENREDAQPTISTTAFCPHCGAKVRVGVLLLPEH